LSNLFVDKISGKSGTSSGAPITLSGDTLTATLGSGSDLTGVTIPAAGVTGTLSSGVTGGNKPYFSVTLGSDQTISHATHTKVNFDTELVDSSSNYDTSNKKFTPTVAGWYQFGSYAIIADLSSSAYYYVRLYKNGSAVARGMHGGMASDWHSPFMGTIQEANGSTDYFEIYIFHVHGSNRILYSVGIGSPPTQGTGFFGFRVN